MMLQVKSETDEITEELSKAFDYNFSGLVKTKIHDFSPPNKQYNIGLLVGPSGSGKTTILQQFNLAEEPSWDTSKSISSHFSSAKDAQDRFSAVGLNSIPTWMKPFHVLSCGEQFRARTARLLKSSTAFDEFTSVVDRKVARSCSYSLQRYIRKENLQNVVFASCHYDIIEWLQPDWVFDTATGVYSSRGCLRRPTIQLQIEPCSYKDWAPFSHHHYLTENINKSARCWLCSWGTNAVGFAASIAYPSGTVKNAFRGHRTVVLPDYQGLGIGVRLSDAIAEIHIQQGKRYFSKTVHPRMGEYRNQAAAWKPTSKNMKARTEASNRSSRWELRKGVSYSHEYIGSD